jgi:hypothetical protein
MRVFVAVLLVAASAGLAAAENKSGEVKFTGPKNESVKVTAGTKLKLEAEFQQITVGNLSAVSVKGTVKNTTAVQMYYSYNVAFLDKDKNVVGCQNFSVPVQPGKEAGAGTFIQLPADAISKITSYTVAFYESDKQIGAK